MGNMHVSLLTLLCSILSLTQALALEERSLYASGGWGLVISSSTDLSLCPSGTQGHIDADVIICCPPNYTSPDSSGIGSRICCPPETPGCLGSFQGTPSCADSTWVLWNQTLGLPDAYFCCLPGQQGEQSSDEIGCVSGNFDIGDVIAQSLGQPTPTGSVATITGGVTVSTNSAGQLISTTSTTSKAGGLLSSIISVATSHSDSRRIDPRPFNIPLFGVLGGVFTVISLVGGLAFVLGA